MCRASVTRCASSQRGLVGWGPSGLGCREVGCRERRRRGFGARRSHFVQERLHALDAGRERSNRLRDGVDSEGQSFGALTAPVELVLHLSELAEALGDPGGVVQGPCTVGPGISPSRPACVASSQRGFEDRAPCHGLQSTFPPWPDVGLHTPRCGWRGRGTIPQLCCRLSTASRPVA